MEKEKDDSIHNRLKDLGLELSKQLHTNSIGIKTPPPWIRMRGDKAYVSGHGPQNPDGSIAGPFGKVVSTADAGHTNSSPKELSIEQGYQSAKLAGLSISGSLKRELGSLDRVTSWLQSRVMINTVAGFTQTTYTFLNCFYFVIFQ